MRVVRADGGTAERKAYRASASNPWFRRFPAAIFIEEPVVGSDQKDRAAAVPGLRVLPVQPDRTAGRAQDARRGVNRGFWKNAGTGGRHRNSGVAGGLRVGAKCDAVSPPGDWI